MNRIVRTGIVLSALSMAFVPSAPAEEPGGREIPTAFAPLEYLLGQWNGQATPRDTAQSFRGWPETHSWAWSFDKGKPIGMTITIKGGKILEAGKLTFDATRKRYRLEETPTKPAASPMAFEGTIDKSGKLLVLDQVRPEPGPGDATLRLSFRPNANFIRYTMWVDRKSPGGVQFRHATEVGLTKKGESLAGGAKASEGPKCIVTGGSATMTISFEGKTYPICCTGCRDEFKDNPAKYIKKAKLMAEVRSREKSSGPAPSAVSRFEDAFAGDVSDAPAMKKKPARPSPKAKKAETDDDKESGEASGEEKSESKPSASAKRAATLLRIGQNLEKSGKSAAALSYYKRIVKEFTDTPAAKTASQRIKARDKD